MKRLIDLAEIIQDLNTKFVPHPGQIVAGRAMLYQNFKKVFIAAGRNWGKSKLAAYLLWRNALENPGSQQYYFAPFQKQAREIMWQSRVLLDMAPEGVIESLNNTESRIILNNGSSIKIDGSDNYEAYRGVKTAGLTCCDEIKDFRPEFLEAYLPNTAAFNSPIMLIGTPDSKEGVFSQYMELAKESSTWFYYQAPTSDNPYISKQWLKEKEEELNLMGEPEQFMREFMAVFVRGGKRSIFPMCINIERPKFEDIKPKDLHKWKIMVAQDPAATSVWAVVFILHNPHTKRSIIFDELYVDDPHTMTARKMYGLIDAKLQPFKGQVREIEHVYDEAAAFARNEFSEVCDWWMIPTRKKEMGIQGYIDLIRTIFLKGLVIVCQEAPKLYWELCQSEKDENGKIPDKNNHATDALGYGFQALGLDLELRDEPRIIQKEEPRGYRIEDEMVKNNSYEDLD